MVPQYRYVLPAFNPFPPFSQPPRHFFLTKLLSSRAQTLCGVLLSRIPCGKEREGTKPSGDPWQLPSNNKAQRNASASFLCDYFRQLLYQTPHFLHWGWFFVPLRLDRLRRYVNAQFSDRDSRRRRVALLLLKTSPGTSTPK